jgi:hypothetical protein
MYAGCTDTDPIDREADHCTGRQGIKELLAIVVDDADARLPVDVNTTTGPVPRQAFFIIFCGSVRSDDICRSGVPYSLALLFPEFFCEAHF